MRMDAVLQLRPEPEALIHFERPRLNRLFEQAAEYPLVVVCAGAGY